LLEERRLRVCGGRVRVCGDRVLQKLYGCKRDDISGEWRRLHREQLYDPNCSINIFQVIKSRRMRWARHVACIGKRRGGTGI
jgi:hypothetical protein